MAYKRLPLIVVLGATACGKSKLAIELSRRFGGEIISADSMQVYHGLDIVTNKVTEDEQSQAKHHLIDFVDPQQRFDVVDFRDKAISIIDDLMKKKKIPILVGGTNYYIESVLWKNFLLGSTGKTNRDEGENNLKIDKTTCESRGTLLDEEFKILISMAGGSLHVEADFESVERFFSKPIYNEGFKHIESDKLWNILEKVDTKSAHLYHPNDKRRIIRCLQIIQREQKNYSQILKDVNISSLAGEASLGGPLRYQETCIFWLDCDSATLDEVLDDRVDQMLDRGLLVELEKFHEDYNKQRLATGEEPNYTQGIFQTIGFKEFHDYLMLPLDQRASDEGKKLLTKSIKEMKLMTKRFARKQLKWIKRRFLQFGTRDLPPLFKLDVSLDDEVWTRQVQAPACEIIESIMQNQLLSEELLNYKQDPVKREESLEPGKLYCDSCERIYIGSHSIGQHLNSRSHKRRIAAINNAKRSKQELPAEQQPEPVDLLPVDDVHQDNNESTSSKLEL